MAVTNMKPKAEEVHTAKTIEKAMIGYLRERGFNLIIPNFYLNPWFESDLLAINNKLISYEYETKISKSDFKADFKKENIHGYNKHKLMEGRVSKFEGSPNLNSCWRPNFFYFLCPDGLIDPKDVPGREGLLYVKDGAIITVKRAKKIHEELTPLKIFQKTAHSLSHRFIK